MSLVVPPAKQTKKKDIRYQTAMLRSDAGCGVFFFFENLRPAARHVFPITLLRLATGTRRTPGTTPPGPHSRLYGNKGASRWFVVIKLFLIFTSLGRCGMIPGTHTPHPFQIFQVVLLNYVS